MERRVVFRDVGVADWEEFEGREPGEGEVRTRSLVSLMSTGTENIFLRRLTQGDTHWDEWIKFPHNPGYSNVGVVESVGPGVTALRPGDRVVSRTSHSSVQTGDESRFAPAPADVPPEEAAWFGLAKIAFMGALAAEHRPGDSVLVVGAGPIGQMAVRWARTLGAERLVALDPVEMRLEMARRGGATATLATSAEGAQEAVREACGGELPRVVIDTTGHHEVFSHCLRLSRDYGRIVLLGDTGHPGKQCLTGDVIRRGLSIMGAHDTHERGEWTAPRIFRLFFTLVQSGRFDLSGLISHRFRVEEATEAYRTANERRAETMGILFDWGQA